MFGDVSAVQLCHLLRDVVRHAVQLREPEHPLPQRLLPAPGRDARRAPEALQTVPRPSLQAPRQEQQNKPNRCVPYSELGSTKTNRERPKWALYLKLKKRKVFKVVQGGTFWAFRISSLL